MSDCPNSQCVEHIGEECTEIEDYEKIYFIQRHFKNTIGAKVFIATGLTLEEAQAHCKDDETSSRTATSKEALELTARCGPWFESYGTE